MHLSEHGKKRAKQGWTSHLFDRATPVGPALPGPGADCAHATAKKLLIIPIVIVISLISAIHVLHSLYILDLTVQSGKGGMGARRIFCPMVCNASNPLLVPSPTASSMHCCADVSVQKSLF